MEFKIFKETVLPGTLDAHSIYFIAPAAKPDYVEIYVTGTTGSTVKRVLQDTDVQTLIDTSLAGVGAVEVVADIAARDALTLTQNTQVMVLDATADATVDSGGATYIYRQSNDSFTKISETEGMDVAVSWANLGGKPSSSVADIDDAVAKKHTHANKTELDKIGESSGRLTYGGSALSIDWNTTGW